MVMKMNNKALHNTTNMIGTALVPLIFSELPFQVKYEHVECANWIASGLWNGELRRRISIAHKNDPYGESLTVVDFVPFLERCKAKFTKCCEEKMGHC